MKNNIQLSVGGAVLCSTLGLATLCLAADTAAPGAAMRLSQSECSNLWQQANPSNSTGLTEDQAKGYVSDFKTANPDGDTTIDQTEWMSACNKGLITNTSSSGASSGTSGKTSDRTPGENAPARVPGSTSAGAPGTDAARTPEGTSDRTPNK